MGWGNASLIGLGFQKEPFMPLLYKQMSFIPGIISPPQLVEACPSGPVFHSCILTGLNLSGICNLGDIFLSHVKALTWDASWGASTLLVRAVSLWGQQKEHGRGNRRPTSHLGPE